MVAKQKNQVYTITHCITHLDIIPAMCTQKTISNNGIWKVHLCQPHAAESAEPTDPYFLRAFMTPVAITPLCMNHAAKTWLMKKRRHIQHIAMHGSYAQMRADYTQLWHQPNQKMKGAPCCRLCCTPSKCASFLAYNIHVPPGLPVEAASAVQGVQAFCKAAMCGLRPSISASFAFIICYAEKNT